MLSEAERFNSKASWDDVSICTKFPIVWIFYVPIVSKIHIQGFAVSLQHSLKSVLRSLYGSQCCTAGAKLTQSFI